MQRFSFYRFFICAWWIKRLKFRILEGLSLFVVRLHVKGRFPIKYLSFTNKISDFDIYTAIGCECGCCHVRIDSQQNYNLDSFWISSGASFGGICHEGTSGVAQARQHILTFEGISITFHVFMLFSLPQKMFTRLPQDANDSLFFYDYDAMLQKCAHHLAPPTSVVTVSDQSIYNKMKQLATVRKWNL